MCQLMWGCITKLSGLQPLKGKECDAFNPLGRKEIRGKVDWLKEESQGGKNWGGAPSPEGKRETHLICDEAERKKRELLWQKKY